MSYDKYKNSYGCFREMWTNEYDKYHREGAPALIHYYLDGSIDMEVFYIDGRLHREDGPAQLRYYHDGSIKSEEFWVYGDFIGYDKIGFWALWEKLTEVERQSTGILKCLARYS